MLTPKQEKFCQNLEVERMSQRAAYIDAYPRAKGWKSKTVDEAACRLANDSKICARREELREQQAEDMRIEATWTRQDAFKNLNWVITQVQENSAENGLSSALMANLINAVKELNGIYGVDRPDTENNGIVDSILKAVKDIE